jgi:hypothetical protein
MKKKTMVVTFGSSSLVSRLILNLMDFIDNSKGKINDYNEDQNQAQNKDYFKDNFIVQ